MKGWTSSADASVRPSCSKLAAEAASLRSATWSVDSNPTPGASHSPSRREGSNQLQCDRRGVDQRHDRRGTRDATRKAWTSKARRARVLKAATPFAIVTAHTSVLHYIDTYIHTYVHTYLHSLIAKTYIPTNLHEYIYTYTYTYTHR